MLIVEAVKILRDRLLLLHSEENVDCHVLTYATKLKKLAVDLEKMWFKNYTKKPKKDLHISSFDEFLTEFYEENDLESDEKEFIKKYNNPEDLKH